MLKFLYAIIILELSVVNVAGQDYETDTSVIMRLNLTEVIHLAQENSPAAMAAKHTFRAAYWDYRSFRANYLPMLSFVSRPDLTRTISKVTLPDGTDKYVARNILTLDGTLSLQQNWALTGGTFFVETALQRMKLLDSDELSFHTNPVSVGYRQSLFGFNYLRWDKKIEPLRYREARKTYMEAMELVAVDAVRKFFALAVALSDYERACFNYANADTLYHFAKGRYDIGVITENELLQLEVNRLTEETNRIDAQVEVDHCRQELNSLLGLGKQIIEVEIEYDVPDFSVDAGLAYAFLLKNSPDMDALQLRLLESRSSVAQARSNMGLKAELYLEFGLSQSGFSMKEAYHKPIDQQQVNVGISLPLLDWGLGRGKVKVAKSRQELVEVQVEQSRSDLETNIQKMVVQFNLQAKRVEIARKTDLTAKRRYEVARRLFLVGKLSVLDLNTSIAEKDGASRGFLAALNNYWNLYYMIRSMTLYDFEHQQELKENLSLWIKY